jgi:hypothetical protein
VSAGDKVIGNVSVLTLVKGRHDHLERLIEGLRRSDVAPLELVIVNMDARNNTMPQADFPIRTLSMPSTGLPLARARNAAAAAASGEVLLFLDVDCIPMRTLIGMMAAHVTRTSDLYCAEVKYLGPGDIATDWRETDLLQRAFPHPARAFPEHGVRAETNAGLFWSLLFGMRRSAFAKIGGFDEDFVGYGAEDTDFGFRAKRAGMTLYFLGGTGAVHQHHDVYDPPLQHFSDIVRNAILFHQKWLVWPMEGWLHRFEALGLINWQRESLCITRAPTVSEILDAKVERCF